MNTDIVTTTHFSIRYLTYIQKFYLAASKNPLPLLMAR